MQYSFSFHNSHLFVLSRLTASQLEDQLSVISRTDKAGLMRSDVSRADKLSAKTRLGLGATRQVLDVLDNEESGELKTRLGL